MAGADLMVDTAQVAQAQRSASQVLTDSLDAQLQSMLRSVEALDGLWEGPNHDAFVATFQQRYSDLLAFDATLARLVSFMQSAGSAYEACEDDVRANVK